MIDGKLIKKELLKELKEKTKGLIPPLSMVILQVGNNPASNIYVKSKKKLCSSLGYEVTHIQFDEDVKQEEIIKVIDELNDNKGVDGIFLQLPIPKHLDSGYIQNRIRVDKDIDGLSDENIGKLAHNNPCLVPSTAQGIVDMLDYYKVPLEGKKVVIIGRSDLVGKPLMLEMINRNATVTLCHSKTKNLKEETVKADILVVAIGKPKFITKEYVKENSYVIDVGINRLEDGSIVGDVDYDDVLEKTNNITPVPGGVGQMTVYEVANNVYKARMLKKIK